MVDRDIYVIDTNILVDYPNIIPSEGEDQPKDPTIDLKGAHIVIPTAVTRELSSFKREIGSERGKVARAVLKRLRNIVENHSPNMGRSYSLDNAIKVGDSYLSILPIHKNFKNSLPFSPSDDDMDGQIILAAIATDFVVQNIPVDGSVNDLDFFHRTIRFLTPSGKVTLLSNDNGLAIRARERGVITSRYGHKMPPPYTGRRDVYVPMELINYFCSEQGIENDVWEVMAEEEAKRPLAANEFVIMHPTNPSEDYQEKPELFFQYVGRYDANQGKILPLNHAMEFPGKITNIGQAIYAEALVDPEIAAVICTGPAGSGKTYMATIYGYNACKTGEYIGVTVVPCASESKIGALPGDLNSKMDPEVQPLKNALRNYLLKNDRTFKDELKHIQTYGAEVPRPGWNNIDQDSDKEGHRSINQQLQDYIDDVWDGWFKNIPIENARGRDFSYELSIYDEFQDQSAGQADTLIKRLGADGKIVITGDVEQIHAPYLDANNNGLVYASQLLYDNPMVAQVCFTEEEVIRHPLVKMVAERQKSIKTTV